jgi:hypothetical protein
VGEGGSLQIAEFELIEGGVVRGDIVLCRRRGRVGKVEIVYIRGTILV